MTRREGDYDVTIKTLAQACKVASAADYQSPTAGAAWGDLAGAIAEKYAGIKDGSKTTDQVISDLNTLLEDE